MFHVGQLVVCVDDEGQEFGPGPYVKRGTVYSIRRSRYGIHPTLGRLVGVWLDEIVCAKNKKGHEWGFLASRFRPVNDSALDIFRKTEAPVREDA